MAVEPSGGSLSASSPVNIGNGRNCHQCRQNRDIVAACKNPRNKKPCLVKICNKCLLNRYGEKAEEVNMIQEWSCPKCRGICNCSVCRKRKGHQPTGILIKTAKATGFSSVSEMLRSAERANHENVGADMDISLKKEVASSPRNTGKENSFAGKVDANLPESIEKNSENIKAMLNGKTDDSISSKKINNNDKRKANHKGVKDNHDNDLCGLEKKPKKMKRNLVDKTSNGEVDKKNKEMTPLPVGTELITVAGIDVCAEEVGNALQFLEFCSVFEKILDVKNGEAEYILEDLLHGKTARRGKYCVTVQFHMRLLSIILTDQGENSASISFNGKNSWFAAIKKLLSEAPHIPKKPGLNFLEKAADYDNLNASEKLRVVNLLCDEILGTQKVRNWIDHQNSQFREKAKEAKILFNANIKELTLSRSKSEAAQAHAKLPESKGLLLKKNCTCDATRIDPIFIEHRGHVYWKLNCCGASDILYQDVKKGNTLTLDEKWFTLDDEGKEIVEKHITSLRIK